MIFYTLRSATNSQLVSQNGFEQILLNHSNPIAALVSSIIVFLVVAYAESSKLELPLAHGKVRGHRGQYPIRLVYASNIPVILMAALLANVNMFTLLFWSHRYSQPSQSLVGMAGVRRLIGSAVMSPEQQRHQMVLRGTAQWSMVLGIG